MPTSRWPLHSYLELGALPTAVPCARLHTRHLLWEWCLSELSEVCELLVSELTTNAVQIMAGWKVPLPIRFRMSSDTVRVVIEVWDADPTPPKPKAVSADGLLPLDEGGRGLLLVDSLSERWGWYPTRELGGKVVWAVVVIEADNSMYGVSHT
jgi:anti-sigma regulatory factor (Ser/Thr protein kinase)